MLGAKSALRLVSSAKSWLCHGAVDRRAPILPANAPAEVPKLSPLDASVHYLRHLQQAWDHQHPDAPLRDQVVTITVPASFDPAARELTAEAARLAAIGMDAIDQRLHLVGGAPRDAGDVALAREAACDRSASRIARADHQNGLVAHCSLPGCRLGTKGSR